MEFCATGTQPIAVALTNGNHDDTDAIAPVYVIVTSSRHQISVSTLPRCASCNLKDMYEPNIMLLYLALSYHINYHIIDLSP